MAVPEYLIGVVTFIAVWQHSALVSTILAILSP